MEESAAEIEAAARLLVQADRWIRGRLIRGAIDTLSYQFALVDLRIVGISGRWIRGRLILMNPNYRVNRQMVSWAGTARHGTAE